MAGDWIQTTLGSIATRNGYGLVDGPFGSNLPASCYTRAGIPVIRGSNLTLETSRFRADEFVFVSHDTAERLERSLCRPLDIVFTKKGTLGQTGLVPEDGPYKLYLLSSNQMKLTVDRRVADPLFIYYFVSSPESREKIIRDSEATGVPKTNVAYLRDFPIALPPLPEQRTIAHILGTLDDKIELNRRMSETLEAMARALFKSWFVDFDPARAKAEGGDPGLPRPLADLFPNSFEDSELGEIPKGWTVKTIGDEVATVLGGTPSRAEPRYWGGDIPWINSGKANEFRVIEPSEFITKDGLDRSATKLLPSRTTVIAITGATLGQVSLTEIETCANQSVVGVIGKPGLPSEFLYFWVKSRIDDLLAWETGGAQQHINKNNVNDLRVLVPSEPIMRTFIAQARPCFDRIKDCCLESRTLTALRDTLLPKLISGELRVKNAERFAAGVGP